MTNELGLKTKKIISIQTDFILQEGLKKDERFFSSLKGKEADRFVESYINLALKLINMKPRVPLDPRRLVMDADGNLTIISAEWVGSKDSPEDLSVMAEVYYDTAVGYFSKTQLAKLKKALEIYNSRLGIKREPMPW